MYKKVETFFQKYPQVQKNQRFLLAISGGLDSTVLAEVFYHLKLDFSMAHCNFHLRGDDSDRDENFVRKLAEKYQVTVFVKEFDTNKIAKDQKIGIEEAARNIRYEWFEQLLGQEKFDWLITAHHLDDSIETVLFNLMRGTGINGLHGILPIRNQIIRPLIEITREDIETFAKGKHLDYCEDYTNTDTKYSRNKIRHNLIPFLKEIQPNFSETMGKTIERLQGVEKVYKEAVQKICDEIVTTSDKQTIVDIEKLLLTISPSTVLFEILSPFGFNSSTIQDVFDRLDGVSGKIFYSENYQAVKDRNTLIICEKKKDNNEIYIIERNQKRIVIPIKMGVHYQNIDHLFKIDKSSNIAYFDVDQLKFPLQLRHWKKGDFFIPFGMKGRKKLSDFFSDQKFSLIDKQSVWLLCSGNDVIWIVGFRTDNRYKVDEKTKSVVSFQLLNN